MTKRNRRYTFDDYKNEPYHDPSPSTKKFMIKYLNPKQKEYGKLIQNNEIVIATGSSGSGKTLIAALHAMDDFLAGRVEKIIICRPAVNAGGEKIGFLPGTLNEKMNPYVRPVFDAFELQWTERQIKTMMEYGQIEIAPLAYMRGRSLHNAFVICDEAQNCTPEQLLMLLTRLGNNSKIVITGDYMQRDITDSCLKIAKEKLRFIPGIAFVEFVPSEVIRHPLVEKILNAWTPVPLVESNIDNNHEDRIDDLGEFPNFLKTPVNPTYMNGSAD